MDCRDFLHLAAAHRDGSLTRYARALFDWHRASCPRCATVTARATHRRPAPAVRRPAPLRTA